MLLTNEAIIQRSSTRAYTEKALSDEQIKTLVDAGLRAPTAANRQELHFSVVKGDAPILKELEDEKNRVNGSTPAQIFYYGAPTVILISGDAGFGWSELDAGIAAENIALMAEGMGLGSLIIGCVKGALRGEKRAYFEKAFDFPAGYEYKIAVAVGYKAAGKEQHTYDAEKQVSYI